KWTMPIRIGESTWRACYHVSGSYAGITKNAGISRVNKHPVFPGALDMPAYF
ncbi:hypothetical protein BLAHAN_04001, partial [Blautia hansenii DSM 20583]